MVRLKKRQTTDVAEADDRKRPRITKGKAHKTVELSTEQLSRTINTVTQTVLSQLQQTISTDRTVQASDLYRCLNLLLWRITFITKLSR